MSDEPSGERFRQRPGTTSTHLIHRNEILNTLAATARGRVPLILLQAPAGFGKTTVLRQWAAEDPRAFVWVRLRGVGTDLGLLLASIDRAQQRTVRRPGTAPGPSSTAAVLSRVFDTLSTPARNYVLVLDGPEGLGGSSGAALVRALVERLPPHCQLAIVSRDRLGLGVAEARGRQCCSLNLGPDQLAFTVDETRQALASVGVDLPDDVVRRVMQGTGGWPAGIARAVRSLRDRPDATQQARLGGDGDSQLVEYFRDEVLDRQSPEIRRFLLHTAVLEELSGPLCDAVLGRTGSALVLEEIERRHLFIRSVVGTPGRYRYQPLFAAVLRSELRHRYPDEEPGLRGRAASWFAQHGEPERAIEQAIAGGDVPAAARLISEHAPAVIDAGRLETLCAWIQALGTQGAGLYPPVGVTAAWAWAMAGNVPQALRSALAAERGSFEGGSPDGSSSLASGVAMVRAAMAPLGVERMLPDAERAVELEPVGTPWHPTAVLLLGIARLINGDTDAAVTALAASVRLNRDSQPAAAQFGLAQLALIAVRRNDWVLADEQAAQSVALMQANRGQDDPPSVLTFAAAAAVADHRADRPAALRNIGAASRLYQERPPVGFPWLAAQAAIVVGRVLLDLGDVPGARSMAAAGRGHVTRLLTEGVLGEQLRILQRRLEILDRTCEGPAVAVLSVAELRVLQLLPTHLRLVQIGDQLHLSRNTVKSHVAAIHHKLGCSTRADAVHRARSIGLLASSPGPPGPDR